MGATAVTDAALTAFAQAAQLQRGSSDTRPAWCRDGRFAFDRTEYDVVRMKGDGRCGYHAMHHFAPSAVPWERRLNVAGPATHGSFQAFADATGMAVRLFELRDVSDSPEWAARAGVPETCLHRVGVCRATSLLPRGRDIDRSTRWCDVLFRRSHYDALARR